jgi:hypothetical protein
MKVESHGLFVRLYVFQSCAWPRRMRQGLRARKRLPCHIQHSRDFLSSPSAIYRGLWFFHPVDLRWKKPEIVPASSLNAVMQDLSGPLILHRAVWIAVRSCVARRWRYIPIFGGALSIRACHRGSKWKWFRLAKAGCSGPACSMAIRTAEAGSFGSVPMLRPVSMLRHGSGIAGAGSGRAGRETQPVVGSRRRNPLKRLTPGFFPQSTLPGILSWTTNWRKHLRSQFWSVSTACRDDTCRIASQRYGAGRPELWRQEAQPHTFAIITGEVHTIWALVGMTRQEETTPTTECR